MPAGITGGFAIYDPETLIRYAREITVAYMEESKWTPFMGQSDTAVIKTGLATQPREGGVVRMRMRGLLRGSGITGDTEFAGNEDSMAYLYQNVVLELIGNAVKSPGRLQEKIDAINFRTDAQEALKDWMTWKMDKIIYERLSANPTNVVVSGNYNTNSASALTTADTFSTADINEMVKRAKLGVDHAGNPVPKLRPVRTFTYRNKIITLKQPFYILKLGSYSAQALREDPAWREAMLNALPRSDDNPVFTGMLGVWNGVIVIEDGTETQDYAGIIRKTDGGSGGNLPYEVNLFLGATAGLMPFDEGVKYWEEDIDAGRKLRIGVDRIFGFAKTKYTASANNTDGQASTYYNKDYGVIVNYAYAG